MKAPKRRGRPRKLHVVRTPSGAISRSKQEPPAKLALEARARMHKLSIDQAHDQQAGQWLGRLHMAYQAWYKKGRGSDEQQPEMSISTGQYHALLSYQTLHNNYRKALCSPGAIYEGGGAGLGDEGLADEWARNCEKKYTKAREAIQDAQNMSPGNLWAALDHCVIQEQKMPHMLGDLRVLANALAGHFNGSPVVSQFEIERY